MNVEIPYDLIAKYLSGECNPDESAKLEQWIISDTGNKQIFNEMKEAWQNTTPENYEPNVDLALGKVSAKLGKQKSKNLTLNRYWIAAAAALIVGFGIFSFIKISNSKYSHQLVETFAQTKIHEIILPDGSVVLLNKNSKLVYPKKFKGSQRKVEFTGEAYFIIAPDTSKPFIIESGKAVTKVLGTEFNLKAAQNDSIVRLIVTKGLVSFTVSEKQTVSQVKVQAGEAGEADLNSGKIKKYINTDPNFLAWKTGILTFNKQKLSTAVETISQFYNQAFELGPGLDTVEFSTTFDSLTIDAAIESLELILDVDIALENGVYIVRQKS